MWTVGWNQPGYLPEDEPATFTTWRDAARDILQELERASLDDENERPYLRARSIVTGWKPNEPACVQVGSFVWWIAKGAE